MGRGSRDLVKIVHNEIEHCDMQLIAKMANLLSNVFCLSSADTAAVFGRLART
jgi:6-phosphogluconate dehydrogenase